MNKTVFLADNDEDDRYLFKEAIDQAGQAVKVVEAESGEEVIQQLRDADDLSQSVVVVDQNMPGMNGIETIEAIKSEPALSGVSVVMMSTSSNPELAQKAVSAGADLFIPKPTDYRTLIDVFKKIFNRFFK